MVSLHAFVLAAALAGSGDVLLLDFGADWCVPCRTMEPTVDRLEQDGYPIRRVDVDANPELVRRFGIGPIPCFVLIRDGRELQRVVGAASYEQLVGLFRQAGYAPGTTDLGGQEPAGGAASPNTPWPRDTQDPASTGSRQRTDAPLDSPAPPPTQAVASHQLTAAQQLALQATVRLRVSDRNGHSRGTGTIIDVHGDEALIASCGHIFRESAGKGAIEVESFAPGAGRPVAGHLLIYECEERDFALLSVRLNAPVKPVKIGAATCHPRPGDAIFSVGCDHGADPTVRVSTISAVDRYVGPPNIEIHGHPVQGRSGGGLFTADGQIIGICNAADMQEDRGIFAALPTIHLALDKIGLREIYLQPSANPTTLTAGEPRLPASPTLPNQKTGAALPTLNHASQEIPAGNHAPDELICLVRQRDGSTHVVVVRNPSAALLDLVATESRQQALPGPSSPARTQADRDVVQLSELPATTSVPVVRAQGY